MVKDIRFSSLDENSVIESIKLYEKFRRGEKLESAEAVKAMPTREITARVYKTLRKFDSWEWSSETLDYRIGDNGSRLCAVMTALDVLEELELIKREDKKITLVNTDKKTELESSEILSNLKKMI